GCNFFPMSPSSPLFQQAKQIVLGQTVPLEEFQRLATYIHEQWQVKLISGEVYEYVQLSSPMRLRLIFPTAADLTPLPVLWSDQVAQIGQPFLQILEETGINRYQVWDLSDLRVDYFLFDELAFQECINQVAISLVQQEFTEEGVWQIQRFWKTFTVFYHTDKQVASPTSTGINEQIKERLRALACEQDPFDTLQERTINVRFDSKTNYEKSGGGLNYYR
ncbi:MAG: hypothetical protein AAF399_27540, partial [Bacteroidota bacterium]